MKHQLLLTVLLSALLIVAPDVLLFVKYVLPLQVIVVSVLWFVPTVAMVASLILLYYGVYHNTFWRLFTSLALCVGFPKLLFLLLQAFLPARLALIAPLLVIALFAYGFFFGWRRIVVRNADCVSPLLPPAFNGYRVLQLSDLHLGTFKQSPGFIRKLVSVVNAQHPDLIVFTGDLVNIRGDEVRPFLADLSKLYAPDGIFSVMGNHDYCEYGQDHSLRFQQRNQHILQYMEHKIGWRLLLNEHVMLTRRNAQTGQDEQIALIGVENISKPPFRSQGNLGLAMGDLRDGIFKILLSHDPTHWRKGVLHQTDIALTLSGHTHAGQIKIGHFSPVKWTYNEWGGKYTEGGSMLYVSLGVGGTVPFRFGAWPEVNVITLRKA
ncbi:MAG: metallophosphoesterase [Prevotella sp.]|nr:metallophosphoesterase [Prevotella sp.]MDY5257953.1 metallophosphoesterase [Prevotella sp.]